MSSIKGYYIEDEIDNIESYGRYFEDEGIELIYEEKLLESPDGYYDLICSSDADFVIVDNHLDKQGVSYDGLDVLKSIRKQDSNIYIILLTNFSFADIDNRQLGEFDQAIMKNDFTDRIDEVIPRIIRAHSRKKISNLTDDYKENFETEIHKAQDDLDELKKINGKLDALLGKNQG
ncbi:response regulator [Bacillus cereus]|uniref:response regulator n=1 Tax=Bacillus cereus TaxID=1396 RepID=UPI0001A0FB11|nr:Two component transcriptional regulator, LuxR [Bacillus cereus Rock3-44]